MNLRLLVTLLLVPSIALSHPVPPTSIKSGAGPFFQLESAQLKAQLENKDFVLINVHTPYESEIAGTELFVPSMRSRAPRTCPKTKPPKSSSIAAAVA